MEQRIWYREKFFTEQEPDDYILVEFHAPVETEPGCWVCEVRISKEVTEHFKLGGCSCFQAINLAFECIRNVMLEKYPDYLHEGDERIEHLIPREIRWYYGDEIRLKTEKYMDELIAEKDAELTRNRIQWLRSHPDWVAENPELMLDEDWAAIRSDDEKQ